MRLGIDISRADVVSACLVVSAIGLVWPREKPAMGKTMEDVMKVVVAEQNKAIIDLEKRVIELEKNLKGE